ncbi:membrane protein insertion efficiency factor YidD [Nakamurella sp.]|uniref:membrane protein insertion efficiency factor YidD n=1 Tax=Nakamurella sp. TaxID=1869182 RepID=UPI003B3A5B7D
MRITRWPAEVLVAPIRFYQRFITPYTPATCRYYPTCSAYAVTALRTRGALVGTALTVWRLLRCNPWSEGGIDHVPAHGWRREPAPPPGSSTEAEPAAGPGPTVSAPTPARDTAVPAPAAPPAGNPADLSGPPSSGGPGTTIRRFAA